MLAVVFVAAVLVALPGKAFADCRDAPAPEPPQVGFAGLLTSPPAEPSAGDPFADPTIPIHHVYGTSWNWKTHDIRGVTPMDCLSTTDSAMYEFNSATGNLMLSFAGGLIGVLDTLERLARESDMAWFGEWIGTVTAAVGPIIMGGGTVSGWQVGLLPLALIVAGIVVAFRARRADASEAFRAFAIALVCVALAGVVFSTPGAASRAVDDAVTTTAEVSGSAFSASLTDGVNRNALYTAWVAGAFGSAQSRVAVEHGPALFDATHYKWVEQAAIDADPAAKERIDAAKAEKFEAVASAVEAADPAAYEWLQGKGERTGTALFALFALALMGWFALVAFVTILVARVMMQVLVIAAPIAAVAGLLPKGESTLRRMLNLFVAALFAVFKFTLAAGVMAIALGLLSRLDPVTALIFMTLLTMAALAVLKPIKTFKTAVPGLDPNRSYFRELIDAIKGLAAGAAAVGSGGATAAVGAAAAAGGQGRERVDLVRMPDRPPEPAPVLVPPRPRVELSAGPAGAQVGTGAVVRGELAAPPPPSVGGGRELPPGPAGPVGPAGVPGLPGAPGPVPVGGVPERRVLEAVPGSAPARTDAPVRVPAPAVMPAPVHSPGPVREPVRVGSGSVRAGGPVTVEQHATVTHNAVTHTTAPPVGQVVDPRQVVIPGEIVTDSIYRRPDPAGDRAVVPDLSHVRDRGTDQPAGEIVLYQSKKEPVGA